jgi:DNA-binding response OmpR family regulator
MKILIVEDEKDLVQSMAHYLQSAEMTCDTAMTLKHALAKVKEQHYDCIVLDIGLPDGSGLKVITEINTKEKDYQPGIIIVSAKEELNTRLEALNMGADDFIIKPFHMPELVARIRSVLRGLTKHEGKKEIVMNELRLVPDELLCTVNGKSVSLSHKEFDLLVFMISNPNIVLSKESLAWHLWGDNADMAESFDFIYSHVKNIRKKLDLAGSRDYIKSVYGTGYKFSTA